jgi:molybdopterin molybdotransferase
MLLALAARANVDAFDLGIARDDASELKGSILRGLDHNVLVMSGGVSAGVMDLIPTVLEQLGVRQVFHHLDLKPGKPLWFGIYEQENHSCLVFGLPGNPVSSLVCFELFVKPALAQLAGRDGAKANCRVRATLTANYLQRDKRMTYFPAAYEQHNDQSRVTPLPWKGSADLRTLVDANALIIFSSGPREYCAGECVDVHLL